MRGVFTCRVRRALDVWQALRCDLATVLLKYWRFLYQDCWSILFVKCVKFWDNWYLDHMNYKWAISNVACTSYLIVAHSELHIDILSKRYTFKYLSFNLTNNKIDVAALIKSGIFLWLRFALAQIPSHPLFSSSLCNIFYVCGFCITQFMAIFFPKMANITSIYWKL